MSPEIVACLIVTGASFVGSVCGFGGGIFAMSLLLLFFDLRLAAVSFAFSALAASLYLGWTIRKQFPFKALIFVASGRAVGVYIGAQLMGNDKLDIVARLLLTAVIVIMSIRELILRKAPPPEHLADTIKVPPLIGSSVGLISGILNGWINMGGPPVILYAYRKFDGRAARRFLIALFLLTFPVQILSYGFGGWITTESLGLFAWMMPGVAIGTIAGNLVQKKIKREHFTPIAWGILLILGLILGLKTIFS